MFDEQSEIQPFGCVFFQVSYIVDFSFAIRKFYGNSVTLLSCRGVDLRYVAAGLLTLANAVVDIPLRFQLVYNTVGHV